MSADAFQYAIVRVVPRIERGERLNVGVVLFCRTLRYLAARIALDEDRLRALAPDLSPELLRPRLEAIVAIAAGSPEGGPIAALSQSERFHWLVAPSSTIVQPSSVHTGVCGDPDTTMNHLMATLVATPVTS